MGCSRVGRAFMYFWSEGLGLIATIEIDPVNSKKRLGGLKSTCVTTLILPFSVAKVSPSAVGLHCLKY